jgi:integrase
MKPFKHSSGRWCVQFGVKYSPERKRIMRYYDTRADALDGIKEITEERAEHGRTAVTAEERATIVYLRQEIGNLSLVPKLVEHWKKTASESITAITAKEAVQSFIKTRTKVGRRTISDIRYRLGKFADQFGERPLHQIHAGELENFVHAYDSDWSRKSFHKRLRPFFAYAVRHRWIAVNPIPLLEVPETRRVHKEVYTSDEFQELLVNAVLKGSELLPFVALAGYGMMRTSELVRLYSSEDVLRWEDIQWERDRIHVRESVGKATRRASGNERFIPIIPALKDWLYSHRQKEGLVIPLLHTEFSKRWRALHGEKFDELTKKTWWEIREPIHNGLRRSAISHKLAAEPDLGIVQCARWAGSSEATIKGHYLELITQEDGVAWFVTATDRLKEVNAQIEISKEALKDSHIFGR